MLNQRINNLKLHRPAGIPSYALPSKPTNTPPIVAPPTIGENASYIGFGGSTGSVSDQHWIHNFQFTSSVPAQNITYADLLANSTFIGTAIKSNGSVRLTDSSGGQSGNLFYNNPVTLLLNSGTPINWSVYFEFSIGGGGGADGLSFILQSNTLNAGGYGGGIGYSGIPKSIAIGFDTWYNPGSDPNAGHIELDVNGSASSIATTTGSLPFSLRGTTGTSDRRHVWIDYTNQIFDIFYSNVNTKPTSSILSAPLNIKTYIAS